MAIDTRLKAVTYCMEHPEFEDKFSGLTGLPDLERLISRIHAGSCTIKNFLKVLKSFKKIQTTLDELLTIIGNEEVNIIQELLRKVPDVKKLLSEIEDFFTLNEEKKDLLPLEGKDELYDAAIDEETAAERKLDEELDAAKKLLKSVCPDHQLEDWNYAHLAGCGYEKQVKGGCLQTYWNQRHLSNPSPGENQGTFELDQNVWYQGLCSLLYPPISPTCQEFETSSREKDFRLKGLSLEGKVLTIA